MLAGGGDLLSQASLYSSSSSPLMDVVVHQKFVVISVRRPIEVVRME